MIRVEVKAKKKNNGMARKCTRENYLPIGLILKAQELTCKCYACKMDKICCMCEVIHVQGYLL